jgi:hypothetical protein
MHTLWSCVAALAASICVAGCISREHYAVRADDLAAMMALPPDVRARSAIPATRLQDHKSVYVSGARIDANTTPTFEIRAPNRRVTVGAVLTLVGTAISLVGSGLFFFSSGKSHLAGEILAPGAEPLMISGTVLWVIGARNPPGEVDLGHADLGYLSP